MVLLSVWRWYRVTYRFDDSALYITYGIIYRKYANICWNRVVTLSVVHSVFLRPFHAVRLRADTLGGSFKDADFTILLRPSRAAELMQVRQEAPGAGVPLPGVYRPGTKSILALALLTSNSFVGIVFIATFVSQAGKLLGNEFSRILIGTVEEVARLLAFGIPPAAAVLAWLLLAGWLAAFVLSFIRYKNMILTRHRHSFSLEGGLLTSREYCISAADVNFIDIRQSLSTRLLNLYSLYISAVGYGKQRNDISCMIPTEHSDDFFRHLRALFPDYTVKENFYQPGRSAIMRFLLQPLIPFCSIPLAMYLLIRIFPAWHTFILFVGLMMMAPSLFFLIIRFIDYRTSGLTFDGSNYTIRYSKGFTLHTVVIPRGKVVLVELRQSPWQMMKDTCDVWISTESEGRSLHRCRNLKRRDMRTLFLQDE